MVSLWSRLGIQKKIFAGLATVVLLMAAMLAVDLVAERTQESLSDRLITRLLPARGAVRNAKRFVLSADDYGAWYLLAGSSAAGRGFFQGYHANVTEIERWLRDTQRQTDRMEERSALAEFERRWSAYKSGNERVFRLLSEGDTRRARSAYVKVGYAPLIAMLNRYERVIQAQIDQTESRRASVRLSARVSAVALSMAALGLAALTALRLGGSLRRRLGAVSTAIAEVVHSDLAQLDASFRSIAAGDFAASSYVCVRRPIEGGGRDELGLLASSYNELLYGLREMSKRIDQSVHDARRRREAEERLAYLQHYDEVTGLANRSLLHLGLGHAIRSGDGSAERIAVVSFGLLGFKKIQDSFGHAFADRLLRSTAQRLCGSLRETDMAARGGDDEFIVVLDPVRGRDEAVDLSRRMLSALSRPFVLDDRELLVNASAGLSLHPYDGQDADELLRNATTAMSYARSGGGGEIALYTPQLRTQSLERVTLESDLQRALANSEFEVYYQPIVNVPERRIETFEALVRWRHPRLGLLEPASFIDVAEEGATIEQLGRWVLETACAQAQHWRRGGFDVGVSVNVSMRQFRGDLCEIVQHALLATQLPANSLELELTESVFLANPQGASSALESLKRLGVRLAIDDFGTGYSSFAYLRTFPLDTIKIDRSFVSEITTRPYDAAIANAVILLGRSLGIRVVAEGVEEAGQAAMLHRLGCEVMQGYFFGKPSPAEQCVHLLRSAVS